MLSSTNQRCGPPVVEGAEGFSEILSSVDAFLKERQTQINTELQGCSREELEFALQKELQLMAQPSCPLLVGGSKLGSLLKKLDSNSVNQMKKQLFDSDVHKLTMEGSIG